MFYTLVCESFVYQYCFKYSVVKVNSCPIICFYCCLRILPP